MLQSIDVLIGLTVIMLALSMAVTVITQFVTATVNSRGHHLKRGLADLIGQLDSRLKGEIGERIAHAVATHPLVSGTAMPILSAAVRLGSVVRREELTKLLLELAGSPDDQALESQARKALKDALTANGVENPAATLKNIRNVVLQLEASHPELAASIRNNMAILQEAKTDFVAKINNWFDQTMDRASQRFTFSTRAVTFAAAAIVALALQVDALMLINRLAADDKLRERFINTAPTVSRPAAPQPLAQPGAEPAPQVSAAAAIDREYLAFLNDNGLIMVPRSLDDWKAHWSAVNPAGVLFTTLLLSLGAPFWYNALGQLVRLRSVLAVKEDAERAARQR